MNFFNIFFGGDNPRMGGGGHVPSVPPGIYAHAHHLPGRFSNSFIAAQKLNSESFPRNLRTLQCSPCSLPCLVPGPVLYQGNPLLNQSHGPLENFSSISIRRPLGTDLQKEGSYDRCLQPYVSNEIDKIMSVYHRAGR